MVKNVSQGSNKEISNRIGSLSMATKQEVSLLQSPDAFDNTLRPEEPEAIAPLVRRT